MGLAFFFLFTVDGLNFKLNLLEYSQLICTSYRLLTDGGTPLEAMQRYPPMSVRCTWFRTSRSPSTTFTAVRSKFGGFSLHLICFQSKCLN